MNKPGEEPLLSLPERHSRILSLLQQNGSISVTQLSELFKVSEVTIRKDLSYLEQQKKLYRTHGSAILISPVSPPIASIGNPNSRDDVCVVSKHKDLRDKNRHSQIPPYPSA